MLASRNKAQHFLRSTYELPCNNTFVSNITVKEKDKVQSRTGHEFPEKIWNNTGLACLVIFLNAW